MLAFFCAAAALWQSIRPANSPIHLSCTQFVGADRRVRAATVIDEIEIPVKAAGSAESLAMRAAVSGTAWNSGSSASLAVLAVAGNSKASGNSRRTCMNECHMNLIPPFVFHPVLNLQPFRKPHAG